MCTSHTMLRICFNEQVTYVTHMFRCARHLQCYAYVKMSKLHMLHICSDVHDTYVERECFDMHVIICYAFVSMCNCVCHIC